MILKINSITSPIALSESKGFVASSELKCFKIRSTQIINANKMKIFINHFISK